MKQYFINIVTQLILTVISPINLILSVFNVRPLEWDIVWQVYWAHKDLLARIKEDDERKKESIAKRMQLEAEAEKLRKAAFSGKDL